VGVKADLCRLKADYDVEGTGAMDVGVLAGKHLGVPVGERSLAGLVARLLRRHLPKDGVRTSDWEQCPLSDKQVTCAGGRSCLKFGNTAHRLR
jgi:ribonuclease D